jgi:hypothetical protein
MFAVIAGLDPAIHPLRKGSMRRMMDPRVKPAGDGGGLRGHRVKSSGNRASTRSVPRHRPSFISYFSISHRLIGLGLFEND